MHDTITYRKDLTIDGAIDDAMYVKSIIHVTCATYRLWAIYVIDIFGNTFIDVTLNATKGAI